MDIPTTHIAKKSDCVARDIGGETIVVPICGQVGDLDSIYTLNETGSSIWRKIDGQTTVAQIVEAICAECDVNPEQATKDVVEFVGSLRSAGLICPSLEVGE